MNPLPIVSVCVITYNQENFLKKNLESIIEQETNFPFEIVIGEDFSTDNTRKIIEDFQTKFPGKINLITSSSNIGAIANLKRTLDACKGKYIAICEGDDHWINNNKLQKQVDFLEAHREYAMVHTNKKIVSGDKEILEERKHPTTDDIFEHLLLNNFIITASILVRSHIYKKVIEDVYKNVLLRNWLMVDYPGWLSIAFNHKIGYIDEVTCVYLVQSESASHSSNSKKQYIFNLSILNIKEFFFNKYINSGSKINSNFIMTFKEVTFHERKRLIIDYWKHSKKNIFHLINLNPVVYFYILYNKIKRSVPTK